jgi:hypothetical protein
VDVKANTFPLKVVLSLINLLLWLCNRIAIKSYCCLS